MTTIRFFGDGLRRLLESEPGFEVVGEGNSGADALRLVALHSPDVLLVDLAMGDMSGLDVLRTLSQSRSPVRTILLTASADNQQMVEALMLGARGLVMKESLPPSCSTRTSGASSTTRTGSAGIGSPTSSRRCGVRAEPRRKRRPPRA